MNAAIILGTILEIILLVWALADVLKNKPNLWGVWILVILLLPIVGSIAYFQWKYWEKSKRKGQNIHIRAK